MLPVAPSLAADVGVDAIIQKILSLSTLAPIYLFAFEFHQEPTSELERPVCNEC